MESKIFVEKEGASLWLTATKPQLVVEASELFAHA